MKAPVSGVFLRVLLWVALSGVPGEVHAWLWTPGTPATPHPAVARIFALDTRGASLGTGTLVAVSQYHGLVITNWHVVRDAKGAVLVQFPDGFASPATILKVDRDWDLAALAIWRPRAKPVAIAVDPPQPGEILMIAGYGQGDYRVSYGPCTQYLSPSPNLPSEFVELRATARQGDSGGPIFNSRGELVGVLFGSGFRETMGAYCGRVRSFLMPLRDVFNNLPPPDPLLVQAANAGAPKVDTNSDSSSASYTNQMYAGVSSTGSKNVALPVQVPLVAGNQSPSTNSTPDPSNGGMQYANGSLSRVASVSVYQGIGGRNTTGIDQNSSVSSQGWRESQADNSMGLVASSSPGNMTTSGQTAPNGTTGSNVQSYQSSYGTQYGDVASSNVTSNRSIHSFSEQTKTVTGSYSASYSNDRTTPADSMVSTRNTTPSYGSYSWEDDSERADSRTGIASDSYRSASASGSFAGSYGENVDSPESDTGINNRFAKNNHGDSPQGDTAKENRGGYWSHNSSTNNMWASNKDSTSSGNSYATAGTAPPYSHGFDRGGTTDFASQDYSYQAEEETSFHHDTRSDASQRQRRHSEGYTASISTGSTDSRRRYTGRDAEEEDPSDALSGTSLAKTIPPKKNQQSPSASASGYSPIPIYDEAKDEYHNDGGKNTEDEDYYSSYEYSSYGNSPNSYSGSKGSANQTSSQSNSEDSESHDDRVNDYNWSSSSNGSSLDRKGFEQNQKSQGHSGSRARSYTNAQRETQNAGSSFRANSSTSSTVNAAERNQSSSASSDRWTSNDGRRDGSQSPGERASKDQPDSSSGAATSETTTKQETAGKTTPGWETMIGVLGLLILFIQSMRWLSLLYDRSYYQRRRAYRPTRRRTTWSSAPPPSYRWYY